MTSRNRLAFFIYFGVTLLAGTGLYLALFSGLRAPYLFTVLLHAGFGLAIIPLFIFYVWQHMKKVLPQPQSLAIWVTGWVAGVLGLACVGFGISLVFTGSTRPHTLELWAHQISGGSLWFGFLIHQLLLPSEKRRAAFRSQPFKWALKTSFAVILLIGAVDIGIKLLKNEGIAHADFPKADFSPSLAATVSGGHLPAKDFLNPETCARCHADVYHQWRESAHRMASFNNPFYRKSVEYASERVGFSPTKFCGACHDPLLLFSGQMDGPIDVSSPEANAGITCQVCHGMTAIRDIRGNGSYTIAPPGQYPFADNPSTILRATHDLMVRLKPEPHRKAMLKPFHTTPEFCSACHKVHIPEEINHFKWTRGQNEYDNWQHSGVSGHAVLSWGPPNNSPKVCRDCHMPPTPSDDLGAKKRELSSPMDQPSPSYAILSHRFRGANTALPTINQMPEQLEATKNFLQENKISVDVVALLPVPVGLPCLLPLQPCFVQPGEVFDIHVIVRNLGVGHTFPGGTIDSNEVWLEVVAKNNDGRTFFHHGNLQENGDVDPRAHFYKAVLIDRNAQLVNKRNVHDWVSTAYARTIPPGASEVARYRLGIPMDAGDHITIEVKLRYRKFFNWFTRFVFSGERAPGKSGRIDQYVDESLWNFSNAPVPELPIVEVAHTQVNLPIIKATPTPATLNTSSIPEDRINKLNSYGLGLLRQRDTKRAWEIFELLETKAPAFIEGGVNLARVQLKEGDTKAAEETLNRILAASPDYSKALFLMGKVKENQGDYQGALEIFEPLAERYPKDRLLCNEIAKLYYLTHRYQKAIEELNKVLAIDPENLEANYFLFLTYNAIGDANKAAGIEARYLRYKPDETMAVLAGQHRRDHPEVNQEAQPIHIHE